MYDSVYNTIDLCFLCKDCTRFLFIEPLHVSLVVEGSMKRAKIVRNTHMAPAGSGMLLMSQVFQQTLAKDSDKLTGANIRIHRCSHAFIYLLSPLRYGSIIL